MNDPNQERIRSLALQIDQLSAELRSLLVVTTPAPVPVFPTRASSSSFIVGDRVQILNKYKSLLHQQGTVTKVGSVFVWFRLDSTGQITSRRHKNLRVISNTQ